MTDARKAAQKRKRDLLITGVLLAVFAVTFTKNVLLYKRPAPPAPPPAQSDGNATQSLSSQLVYVTNLRMYDKLRDEQRAVWEKEWVRDPFVPQATVTSVTKAVNLTLKGVLWDDKNPKAIVNEKTLLIGDTLYGYTVVDIKPRSVILRTGEKNVELNVFRTLTADPA